MTDLITQLIINGFVSGARYGLVALGFALVLSVSGYIHFAHGAICLIAGYVFYSLWVQLAMPWPVAGLGTMAAGIALALFAYLAVYRQVPRKSAHGVFICALGMMIFLENSAQLFWGSESLSLRAGGQGASYLIGQAVLTDIGLATIVTAIALLAVMVCFMRATRTGRAMRAIADHRDMANVVGINVQRITIVAFVISAILAVPAAVLAGLDEGLVPHLGTELILSAVAATIIGGIGSLSGAVIGGLLIGIVQNLAAGWLPTSWMNSITFLAMFMFIAFHPSGLFGKKLTQVEV